MGKKGKIVDNTMHAVVTPLGLLKLQGLVGRGASEALEHLLVTALNLPNIVNWAFKRHIFPQNY